METLKAFKAQEQADACWKSFKERTLTKKAAKENLLLNSNFDALLKILIVEDSENIRQIALDFVVKCIEAKIVSPVALLTLLQQNLPPMNVSKSVSLPALERVCRVVLLIEQATGVDFTLGLASNDLRSVPLLLDKIISESNFNYSSSLVNFLLGDPDLVLSSSVFDDSFYKMSRCRVLTHLLSRIENEDCAELVMTYLIWNSGRPCIMELECLSGLVNFFSCSKGHSIVHTELFEVYIEVICNVFFKFGSLSETLNSICSLSASLISDYSVFRIGCLLLIVKNLDSTIISSILKLLSGREKLISFTKVCCAKVMLSLSKNSNLVSLIKSIFSNSKHSFTIVEKPLTDPFTEFGCLTDVYLKGSRPQCPEYEMFFDFVDIARNFENLSAIDIKKFSEKGHFEMIFSLLVSKWGTADPNEVIKGFLELLGHFESEDPEAKIIRYSWVVDFFESNFSFEMYLEYLPLICEFVSSSDNVLFALVQQKISHFLSVKDNAHAQIPAFLSLNLLFDSSQTRQSRLNFLASMSLSFLHNLVSNNILKVDTRAVFLAFKLLENLCKISVIDPRDVWTKYIQKILATNSMISNSYIRGSICYFSASLRVIPDGPEGEIDELKFAAVSFLIKNLSTERDEFVLDRICEALTKFKPETLQKVELALLKPEVNENKDEDDEKEVSVEEILSKSIIFNPSLLHEISFRYKNSQSTWYQKLWVFLIDHEVETMPRTKFLGSNEKSSIKSEAMTKAVINPSFCNGLVFETFETADFSNIESVIKCIKGQLIPLVPSVSTLLWYIRPHLPDFLLSATAKIFNSIDDQRVKQKLCDHEYLLSNLKSGTTPHALSSLLLTVSAILKAAYSNQIISENVLFNSWIKVLTERLGELSEFKLVISNEEFLAAFAMSCNILSGCSREIDKTLSAALNSFLVNNTKLRDGIAVYCAIEALSKLSVDTIEGILTDAKISSKRKLIAMLAWIRLNRSVKNFTLPEKSDDISAFLSIILSQGQGEVFNSTFNDPLEFKGLSLYAQSLICREELGLKAQQRAFDSGNVPASLKYDAVLSYLLGNDLDFLSMKTRRHGKEINISALKESTKDPKCLALLQFVSRSDVSDTKDTASAGLDRFDRMSWLKFFGLSRDEFKYEILKQCKLLPRIDWGKEIGFEHFDFVVKHVSSITPITNIPYINLSLLATFLEGVVKYLKNERCFDAEKVSRIIEILANNSEEKSVHVLAELLRYSVESFNDNLLELILKESVKYPLNLNLMGPSLIESFSELNPERFVKLSSRLTKFAEHFNLNSSKLYCFDIKVDGKNAFSELEKILKSDSELLSEQSFRIKCFSLCVGQLKGKARIRAILDIIDLMFIYQQSEDKFLILSRLITEILEDVDLIILESKKDLFDPDIVNKIRSRSSVLSREIYEKFEANFVSYEFEKESF